jgi:hypothetical protein
MPMPLRKLFPLLLAALLVAVPVLAAEERDPFALWIQHYYKHSDPQQVAENFVKLATSTDGELGASGAIIGFISGLSDRHPEHVREWIKGWEELPSKNQRMLFIALQASRSRENVKILDEIGVERLKALDVERLKVSINPDRISISTKADFDFLWGRFFASGSPEPIKTIIAAMANEVVPDCPNPPAGCPLVFDEVTEDAHWSLLANAREHDVVLQTCADSIPHAPNPHAQERLKKIVAKAQELRDKR